MKIRFLCLSIIFLVLCNCMYSASTYVYHKKEYLVHKIKAEPSFFSNKKVGIVCSDNISVQAYENYFNQCFFTTSGCAIYTASTVASAMRQKFPALASAVMDTSPRYLTFASASAFSPETQAALAQALFAGPYDYLILIKGLDISQSEQKHSSESGIGFSKNKAGDTRCRAYLRMELFGKKEMARLTAATYSAEGLMPDYDERNVIYYAIEGAVQNMVENF